MKGPVLAIDHGTKRTGFASVDALRIVSKALDPFHGPGDDAKLLEHVAALDALKTDQLAGPQHPRGAKGDVCVLRLLVRHLVERAHAVEETQGARFLRVEAEIGRGHRAVATHHRRVHRAELLCR